MKVKVMDDYNIIYCPQINACRKDVFKFRNCAWSWFRPFELANVKCIYDDVISDGKRNVYDDRKPACDVISDGKRNVYMMIESPLATSYLMAREMCVYMMIESLHATSYLMAREMLATYPSPFIRLRDIHRRNLLSTDLVLYNGPKSNVDVPNKIGSSYTTFYLLQYVSDLSPLVFEMITYMNVSIYSIRIFDLENEGKGRYRFGRKFAGELTLYKPLFLPAGIKDL